MRRRFEQEAGPVPVAVLQGLQELPVEAVDRLVRFGGGAPGHVVEIEHHRPVPRPEFGLDEMNAFTGGRNAVRIARKSGDVGPELLFRLGNRRSPVHTGSGPSRMRFVGDDGTEPWITGE